MKVGINFKIDVTKLDKERFFKGKKGIYCDLTAFVDTENVGEYGDNGVITQATTKEERDNQVKMPICGNVRVFYKAMSDASSGVPTPASKDDEDIPVSYVNWGHRHGEDIDYYSGTVNTDYSPNEAAIKQETVIARSR